MLQLHMLLSIFCTSRAFSLLVLYYYNKVGRHLMEGVGAYVGMYVCRKDVEYLLMVISEGMYVH